MSSQIPVNFVLITFSRMLVITLSVVNDNMYVASVLLVPNSMFANNNQLIMIFDMFDWNTPRGSLIGEFGNLY